MSHRGDRHRESGGRENKGDGSSRKREREHKDPGSSRKRPREDRGSSGGSGGGGGDEQRRSSSSRRHRAEKDRRSKSRSGSESPLPDIRRRRKTLWDVMIPDESTIVLPPPVAVPMNPQLQRQQKRLYVGNLPVTVSEIELMEFFNTAMLNANVVTTAGSPVISATINREKAYAFIEFRTAEEASSGMSLDGITLQGHALRVRRPKDYQPLPADLPYIPSAQSPSDEEYQGQLNANLNIVSTNVADTPYKIFIGGIPPHLNEGDIKKLLSHFGQLKSFNLVRDSLTGLSKGFAFCEYADPGITDTACSELHGMTIGDKSLVVQRASVNAKKISGELPSDHVDPKAAHMLTLSTPAAQLLATAVKNATADPTRILVLMNILNLYDFPGETEEPEFQELVEDITEECERYGKVIKILIPRPTRTQRYHTVEHFDGQNFNEDDNEEEESKESSEEEPPPPGFGKVFVEYEKIDQAKRAQTALSGRRYDGRMVITSFHPEDKWIQQILEPDDLLPEPNPYYQHIKMMLQE